MQRPQALSGALTAFATRTPTLAPATHTNSYALGAREVLLVEPASPYEDEQRAWIDWARGLGSAGRTPIAIVVTHHHADHVGGVDVLSRELGLPVWAHVETAARITTRVVRRLADGDTIDLAGPTPARWTVLHTPGHAPGHVCLLEAATGTLVAGDMVASMGTILIQPHDGDMRAYLQQLERLAALDARLALPAHGDPIAEPTVLFRRYVAHRLAREAKILAAVVCHGHGASVEQIAAEAYDDVPAESQPVARLSTQAHLVKLVGDSRIRALDEARYIAIP